MLFQAKLLATRASLATACLSLLLAGAGCAKTQAPHGQLATSQATLKAAEELKAGEVPKAALHLQMARDNTERAQKLMEKGNHDEALYALMRAQSDAELALILAKEAAAQKDAQTALDKVRTLRTQAGE
jgi:hypothetical protein